jgi:hypothetical protein
MTKDAVLFGGTDPGRFNPTYMIFSESFLEPKDRANPAFDRRDVAIITQNALADGTYLSYIRAHYNRSAQNDPNFFQEFEYTRFLPGASALDSLFMGIGQDIEKERRVGSSFFKPEHFKDPAAIEPPRRRGRCEVVESVGQGSQRHHRRALALRGEPVRRSGDLAVSATVHRGKSAGPHAGAFEPSPA